MLIGILVVLLCGFTGAMALLQLSERAVEARLSIVRALSTTSIEQLAAISTATLEAERVLADCLHAGQGSCDQPDGRLEASLAQLEERVQRYLMLELLPGERSYWLAVRESSARFDAAVRNTHRLVELSGVAAARDLFAETVAPAGAQMTAAATRAIAYDAELSHTFASDLEEMRERTRFFATALTAFCILIGIFGGWVVQRQIRLQRAFFLERTRLLEARAAELDMFAGRVAHDIRNPLTAAKLATELIKRKAANDGSAEFIRVILRALSRAEAITNDLLQFARAGAHNPDPGARSSVREVVEDVATGMAPDAARTEVALHVEPIPPVLVACSSGVYLSLLGNLVRNAIKFMGSSTTRQVVLRVIDLGAVVRTEVTDTGPGIPPEIVASLFQPYFRAGGRQEGLGLGLATVKKLAEGHGGRAGVTSQPGSGSTFWFELPHAGVATETSSHDDPSHAGDSALRH
jgi:signal transduction histidine kinase